MNGPVVSSNNGTRLGAVVSELKPILFIYCSLTVFAPNVEIGSIVGKQA